MANPFGLDRDLARRTRPSRLILFIVGTLLVPAAVFTLFMAGELGGTNPARWNLVLCSAAVTSACGIMAWTALGLLFFKASSPRWHLACWPVVGVFGMLAIPSTLLSLSEGGRTSDLALILFPALTVGAASVWMAGWNCRLAMKSLKRTNRVSGLQRGGPGR